MAVARPGLERAGQPVLSRALGLSVCPLPVVPAHVPKPCVHPRAILRFVAHCLPPTLALVGGLALRFGNSSPLATALGLYALSVTRTSASLGLLLGGYMGLQRDWALILGPEPWEDTSSFPTQRLPSQAACM
jgi:hypothetical protein